MRLLSRAEEMILLLVLQLKSDAYSVIIREQLTKRTNKKWSFGTIYDALERLERNGCLTSGLSKPHAERGGRSKRIYQVTSVGISALREIKKVENAFWAGTCLQEYQ